MPRALSLLPTSSFLISYRLPDLRFVQREHAHPSLSPVWRALRTGGERAARTLARNTLSTAADLDASTRAALLAALATAEARIGKLSDARRHAEASVDAWPAQWLAHRAYLGALVAQQGYQDAYAYLGELAVPEEIEGWDEALPPVHQALASAAWAWQLGAWDEVATHLVDAYPGSVATMPTTLKEDWFRLALYRDRPEDAVEAAQCLIDGQSPNASDLLLQALVRQGWAEQALELYRTAFARLPQSALLRRRLVALCIRTGAIEEARRLSSQGPLQIAV